jgi:signal transduction histidine kinase
MYITEYIYDRIRQKHESYKHYSFSVKESIALATFFDLAQEFESIQDLYILCVAVPNVFFGSEARLYMIEPKLEAIVLVSSSEDSGANLEGPPPDDISPHDEPYYTGRESLVLTIRGNKMLIDQLPVHLDNDVIGFLEVLSGEKLDKHRELFFEKYANRIGFNVHNRFLGEKNIEHLKFISTLVADIEHNIIVPNMIYKLFLKHLKSKIVRNEEIEGLFTGYLERGEIDSDKFKQFCAEMSEVNNGLKDDFMNLEKHYKNMSLFLETLLRRSHFDEGRLILRTKPCHVKNDIIVPQLERFAERFVQMGILVDDSLSFVPEEELISVVDIGLMAQVYANLFSNALKYTDEVVTDGGETKKFLTYGYEVIRDFFGDGKDGVKYNVYSTGPHIRQEERESIFEEGVKGSNTAGRPGTGHGLAFIRNIIELHGGVVGYEAKQYGNNFYFILPVKPVSAEN